MPAAVAAALEPKGEARIALESVRVEASLRGLLAEVVLTQSYRNLESRAIEAVYTFPLPLGALLLGLELELGDRRLSGMVKSRTQAQADYEGAVDSGDSAVLLETPQPGLFTLNLASLLPGERALIRLRYAELHRWQGETLRLYLPTTVAPRYGEPARAGLEPHQVPATVLDADFGFSLVLRLEGALARAAFECPTHPVAVREEGDARVLSLSGGLRLMDRDFVLTLREPAAGGEQTVEQGLWAADGEGFVALAPFHPRPEGEAQAGEAQAGEAGRCLKLVVDCSGSMAGDSIAQAKRALTEILDRLRPGERFNLIAFGSTARTCWRTAVPADARHLAQARAFVAALQADMGGTEIGAALKAAYRSGAPADSAPDLLLITDGEVWEHDPIIARAVRSGHRHFAIGVGAAVSEAFLRRLAEASGGACELVSPREDMAERIVRQAGRIRQPRARHARLYWPGEPLRQVPDPVGAVFAGDTLHLFAWLPRPPAGEATFELGF
jgi:Ca-activated chloride channel family protein